VRGEHGERAKRRRRKPPRCGTDIYRQIRHSVPFQESFDSGKPYIWHRPMIAGGDTYFGIAKQFFESSKNQNRVRATSFW
jgi:hypothetical protein